jgi:hypothetical protein
VYAREDKTPRFALVLRWLVLCDAQRRVCAAGSLRLAPKAGDQYARIINAAVKLLQPRW